uniref:Pfam-B_726 domain containing protein n=1 Tax=Echinococcus granulosus TaxID=6210 RepID=A0A068WZP4_ECHGR|nr:Pfam-B_726 domain containing protein [Echinococcus granulosus]
MKELVQLICIAFGVCNSIEFMLLVCIVGVSLLLLLVYKRHFIRETGLVLQAKNSKRRKKKAKRKSRQRVNPSNGQAPSCGTHEGIVNVAHGSFEEMLEEEPGGADEDESGEEAAEDGDDLNAGADVSVDGAVAHDQEGDSEEQVDACVTESPPQRKTSKREKHGNGKSANRGRGHPSQYHVQPSVDPSRIAKMSEMQNYLRTGEIKYKQQEADLRSIREEISDLQRDLRICRLQSTHLEQEKANAIKRLEKTRYIRIGKDRLIRELRKTLEVMMSNIEKKDNELRKLHSSVNKIVQEVFSYDQDLISNPEDPVEQVAALQSAFSPKLLSPHHDMRRHPFRRASVAITAFPLICNGRWSQRLLKRKGCLEGYQKPRAKTCSSRRWRCLASHKASDLTEVGELAMSWRDRLTSRPLSLTLPRR